MSTPFPLFRLPGELRNRVYELVLTSSEPLRYSVYSADQVEKPVLGVATTSDRVTLEFNQLKYVNKALYAECAGLEIKYSDISFGSYINEGKPPGYQFIAWVETMTPTKQHWLNKTTITLQDPYSATKKPAFRLQSVPDTAHTIAQLAEFCRTHSNITMTYSLPHWKLPTGAYYPSQSLERERWDDAIWYAREAAHFYYHALRPPEMHPKTMPAHTSILFRSKNLPKQARRWRNFTGAGLETLQAENLRFIPGERGDLVELRKWRALSVSYTLADAAIGWSTDGI
jgi:hypothetical protein